MKRALIVTSILFFLLISLLLSRVTKRKESFIPCGVSPSWVNTEKAKSGFYDDQARFVFYSPCMWEKNELKVYFVDTYDQGIIDKTMKIARHWSDFCAIKFIWTTNIAQSDIRVSFEEPLGYQSYIGSLSSDDTFYGKTTLWLYHLYEQDDRKFKEVVLHEFGHAIGLLHELQSPKSKILWDTPVVYKYYDSLYGWSHGKVDSNVFIKYYDAECTEFDPKSIMVYAVPAQLTKDKKEIPWPDDLSKTDQKTIKIYYK